MVPTRKLDCLWSALVTEIAPQALGRVETPPWHRDFGQVAGVGRRDFRSLTRRRLGLELVPGLFLQPRQLDQGCQAGLLSCEMSCSG